MARITVKGPGDDRKVILWEKSPEHPTSKDNPDGEIFVVNDGQEYRVGESPAIKKLLHEGRLVKVETVAKAAPKKEETPPPPKVPSAV